MGQTHKIIKQKKETPDCKEMLIKKALSFMQEPVRNIVKKLYSHLQDKGKFW